MIFEKGHFKSTTLTKGFINESLKESRQFSASSISIKQTVFVSHKHDELEQDDDLKGFIEMLQGEGVKVYIDSMDNTLPQQTCGDTASRIKEIIKYCDKFILLATEKAIESYWCNWELGIGDVHKFKDHIAIVPIKDKGAADKDYSGNEYLQIYPRIDYQNGNTQDSVTKSMIGKGYYVSNPLDKDGVERIKKLSIWLKEK